MSEFPVCSKCGKTWKLIVVPAWSDGMLIGSVWAYAPDCDCEIILPIKGKPFPITEDMIEDEE